MNWDKIWSAATVAIAVFVISAVCMMISFLWDSKKKMDAHNLTIPYKIVYRDTCSIRPVIKDSL
jgi:hypothetical protein